MTKGKIPRPTKGELEILSVLWKGPTTVRRVHEVLNKEKQTGYTTTLKIMQCMVEKGLVVRDESHRTHLYRARLPQKTTQRQLVKDLTERAFDGSAEKLVMRALSARKVSPQELARIRQMLDELEGK